MTNNHLFSNLPLGSVGFHITSALPLQTLKGIGLHHITLHDYNWDVLYLEFSTEYLPLLYYIHQSSGPTFHLDESCTLPEQMRDLYLNATSNQLESVFDNSKAAYSFLLDLTSYALYHPKLTSPRVTLAKFVKFSENLLELLQLNIEFKIRTMILCVYFTTHILAFHPINNCLIGTQFCHFIQGRGIFIVA